MRETEEFGSRDVCLASGSFKAYFSAGTNSS